ncbi:MAG TPA: AIR synthase related protein [Chloroflexota bacterium]
MGSILDALPREGALFAGGTGALRLPSGGFLLVKPGSATRLATEPPEPSDNPIPAPDEDVPVHRPAYLDEAPLVPLPPQWDRLGEGTFQRLWARRDQPDDYVRQDPYTGGAIRVAQAARAVVAAGGEPVALSYRLTFGDPRDPEAAYQLKQAVRGMADAAQMLGLPVLAGELRTDPATGLHPSVDVFAHTATGDMGRDRFQLALEPSRRIVLLGRMTNDLSGSLYLEQEEGFPPPIDLIVEGRVLELAREFGGGSPLARGGLLLTLARCCARAGVGARLSLPSAWANLAPAAVLFGEAQSRFLLSLPADALPRLREAAAELAVPAEPLGEAGGAELIVDGTIKLDVRELTSWTI